MPSCAPGFAKYPPMAPGTFGTFLFFAFEFRLAGFKPIWYSMDMKAADEDIFWHPAFLPALQLEFEAYLDVLHFEAEHQLTTAPLQIDVLIIKKDSGKVIGNPVAGIFKKINIFEYKSPAVSLSLDGFYKGISYVLLYKTLNKADITDITLSIVVTQHPQSVIQHIRDVWKCEVTERESGIYVIRGFLFPIQIIENKKLSQEHRSFLSMLNKDLDKETVKFVLKEAAKPHKVDISAYIDVIAQANPQRLKEILMENQTLEQVFEELGLIARWEAKGEARGRQEGRQEGEARGRQEGEARGRQEEKVHFARKLIQKGWGSEEIAETTGLDLDTVQSLHLFHKPS